MMVYDDDAMMDPASSEDTTALQAIVSRAVDDAVNFIDTELSTARAIATDYYRGKPFGDEKDGRSKVVTTEVRDTIHAILPSILRVFYGAEDVVEYAPVEASDVQSAKQATQYANRIVLEQDNPGFMIFYSWFHDALLKRTGFVKSYWEEKQKAPIAKTLVVYDPAHIQMLSSDPSVISVDDVVQNEDGTLSVTLTYGGVTGKLRVESVPPEEMLFARDTRDFDSASFVGQRREMTRGALIAMGVDAETIDDAGTGSSSLETNVERLARNPHERGIPNEPLDESDEPYEYIEAYLRVDHDGDGLPELRKVCTVGAKRTIVMNDVVDEDEGQPFSVLVPHPIPHTQIGLSVADNVQDVQWIKSHLMRAMNDSLSLSIFPRMAYVEGRVSLADVLNDEIGAPIRMDAPGMVQPFVTPFDGNGVLSVLAYFDKMKEQRVGLLPATMDSSALQSSTKDAVNASVNAAHQQVEMICRVFAETGVKHLFRRILRLSVKHQTTPRMARLTGAEFTPIDPSSWNAEMDVSVNVALGMGLTEQKIAVLAGIVEKQELILTTLGAQNPIVSLPQYANALSDAAILAGRKDANRYFTRLPSDWQPPPPPPGPPAMDAEMELVKIEGQRAQMEHERATQALQMKGQIAEQDLQFRLQEMQMKAQGEQQALQLKLQTIEQDAQSQIQLLQLKLQELQVKVAGDESRLEMDRERMLLEDDRARDQSAIEASLAQQKMELEFSVKSDATQVKADVETYRAELQADTAHAQQERPDE